jgi:hypothetical protein
MEPADDEVLMSTQSFMGHLQNDAFGVGGEGCKRWICDGNRRVPLRDIAQVQSVEERGGTGLIVQTVETVDTVRSLNRFELVVIWISWSSASNASSWRSLPCP